MPESDTRIASVVDHLFRSSAGQMVSYLTRVLGPAHLDLAEEAVQDALAKALQTWPFAGIPDSRQPGRHSIRSGIPWHCSG
jgi:RNA polymerase sigma-70 factor (ECF subfamily)